ncbi:hypothetical protein [Jannaschia formosa]|uniref:hypothetical protein n=1 Tax=Jannaschia formosa TaxID=2259592 RepID=UPI0010753FA9|nr:hypothetical protein [Jannaschia formosa]TFL16567.1 hypothetical protein DR046_19410 [Jannaschia formosa]
MIDTTLMPKLDPNAEDLVKALDDLEAAEVARLLKGHQPRFHLRVGEARIAAALNGDYDESAALCVRLHDYQRLSWAAWLYEMGAPIGAWQAALDVGLTQQHFNRAISVRRLLDMLRQIRNEKGLGLPPIHSDTFTVYRGGDRLGISWTLDQEVAVEADEGHRAWYGSSDGVHEMQITRNDVLYYTDYRTEKEVLVDFVKLNIRILWPDDPLSRKPVRAVPNERMTA